MEEGGIKTIRADRCARSAQCAADRNHRLSRRRPTGNKHLEGPQGTSGNRRSHRLFVDQTPWIKINPFCFSRQAIKSHPSAIVQNVLKLLGQPTRYWTFSSRPSFFVHLARHTITRGLIVSPFQAVTMDDMLQIYGMSLRRKNQP